MCKECGHYICPSNCPNSSYEEREVCRCEICNKPILEGDEYYEIGELNYCEDCVLNGYKVAEVDE